MGWKIKQRKQWKDEGNRAEKREGQKIKKNEEGKKKYNSKCDCPQLIKRNEFSLLSIIQRVISISWL